MEEDINLDNIEDEDNEIVSYHKLKEIMSAGLEKCVCKIFVEFEEDNQLKCRTGTGFFCYIPKHNIKVFMTNNHIMKQDFLDKEKNLEYIISEDGKDIKKNINLEICRIKFTDEILDFTIIQILQEDNIEKFVEIDNYINSKDYIDDQICCIQFPKGKELKYSNGKVLKKKDKFFLYTVGTLGGSSGSPILLIDNFKLIGLHKGVASRKNNEKINFGIKMNFIMDKINNKIDELISKAQLSEDEKNKIKLKFNEEEIFDEELYSLYSLNNPFKNNSIKEYYNSLLKSFPLNDKKIIEETEYSLPFFKYPSYKNINKKYYTLLMIGEKNAGKTSLLDIFANYMEKINFNDPWRYKVVEKKIIRSGTEKINIYYFNNERKGNDEINIRIIDTPGLNTIISENDIMKQYQKFFEEYEEIQEIDYILLVCKNHVRYTYEQIYILDTIRNIFPKNAFDKFLLIFTFYNKSEKVHNIEQIKEKFNCVDYFCFNYGLKNYKFYDKYCWKLGMNNIKKIISLIAQKNQNPINISLLKQVLNHRLKLLEYPPIIMEKKYEIIRLVKENSNIIYSCKENHRVDQNPLERKEIIKENYENLKIEFKNFKNFIFELNNIALCPLTCKNLENLIYAKEGAINSERSIEKENAQDIENCKRTKRVFEMMIKLLNINDFENLFEREMIEDLRKIIN